MQRTVVLPTILALTMLLVVSVHMDAKVVGLSGDVFAQDVATWREVTITKTIPPGPSDEEVITRRQVIIQETLPPAPPRSVLTEVVVRQPPPQPLREEVIVTAPSPQHVWVSGYWTWNNGWRWMAGHWELPPQRVAQRLTVWVPGQWMQSGYEWVWRPGHWE
jgi:hypothetical protein